MKDSSFVKVMIVVYILLMAYTIFTNLETFYFMGSFAGCVFLIWTLLETLDVYAKKEKRLKRCHG